MSNENPDESLMHDGGTPIEREPLEIVVPAIFNAADEARVEALEKAAANAPRVVKAMNRILVAIAHSGDWVSHDGKKASLCSAGAERFLKFFPMKFLNWKREKQDWTDKEGEAYRYIYSATCVSGESEFLIEGRFSTRDKLLGFKNGKWKPLEEIDETDIMAAARHICIGEGVKAHLGLRAMPISDLETLGVRVDQIGSVPYQKGGQGGAPATSTDDKALQQKLISMALALSNGDTTEAGTLVETESAFKAKDGKEVPGKKNPKQLTGKRLEITYGKIKQLYVNMFGEDQYNGEIEGSGNGDK